MILPYGCLKCTPLQDDTCPQTTRIYNPLFGLYVCELRSHPEFIYRSVRVWWMKLVWTKH